MKIREYSKKDIDELVMLWATVFGDEENFIIRFFEMLENIGTCIVGEEDGRIIAMTSVITGMSVVGENEEQTVGYIYAVAVDDSYRGKGYGAEISKAAFEMAKKLGCAIITTMPSSDSLYTFYENALGMKTALKRTKYAVEAKPYVETVKVAGCEYNARREQTLKTSVHLEMSDAAAQLYDALCTEYGGGLYISETGVCSAQLCDDKCIIYDIVCTNPDELAASVAYVIGAKCAQYYLPSEQGDKFIMTDSNSNLPLQTVYNVAFE